MHRAEILRLRGACDEAEREALVACEELSPYLRREMGWPLSELGRIRLRKGDVDGAEEALLAAHRVGWEPQPGLALVRLAQGDVGRGGRRRYETRWSVPRGSLRRSCHRTPTCSGRPLLEAQVEIEIAGGDLGRARAAADELERVAARFQSKALVAGATLARGRVRLAEGDAAEAERCCSEAARLWNEIGAPYEAALARMVLAEALRAGGSEDQRRSRAHRRPATILDRIEVAASATTETNVFRREGDYWSVVFEGRTVRVRDLKGMRYLAQLLAHPGREFHVLDLVAAETGQQTALGDAGEILDERAKTAYRRRLAEIEDDIEQARALEDAEREAQADAERDFLVRELARAVGLGGRDRRAASASERARSGVTRAIRQGIARIGEHHPQLGEHLDRAVRTGTLLRLRCPIPAPPRRGRRDVHRRCGRIGRAPTSWRAGRPHQVRDRQYESARRAEANPSRGQPVDCRDSRPWTSRRLRDTPIPEPPAQSSATGGFCRSSAGAW